MSDTAVSPHTSAPVTPSEGLAVLHLFCKPTPMFDGDAVVAAVEAAVRSVCEPYFTRPLSEISLGEVLVKLFKVAHRFELTIQPQLLLLQKTLLNIEGVGRLLDPKLDIWAVAKPVLDEILRERYSFAALVGDFRKRVPELVRSEEHNV